jgi:hypothetical protein
MDKDKAIQILKQAIDQAVKLGAYPNIETVTTIAQALQTIINELKK